MKKVIVTGSFGFVGLHVVNMLLKNHYKVVAVDIDDFFNRKQFIESTQNLDFVYADLSKEGAISFLPSDADYIIHLAALPHVDYSYYYENETIQNNVQSLNCILNYAKINHAKVLFTSSVEVYCGNDDKAYSETSQLSPQSIYGCSKQMCEQLVEYYIKKHGIECTILRLTNLYGPAQLPDRIIPRNICRITDNLEFDLTSNFYRDFLYVEDAVAAIIKMMEVEKNCETYNLSTGSSYNMEYVANRLVEQFQSLCTFSFDSEKTNNNRGRHLKIDCKKIATLIDPPKYNIDEGLKKTVEWYQNNIEWRQQFKSFYESLRDNEQFIIDTHFIHSRLNG